MPNRLNRLPRADCQLEQQIAANWSPQHRGWDRFCRARAPNGFSRCCLQPEHGGHVHIEFTIDPTISFRWTDDGRWQE